MACVYLGKLFQVTEYSEDARIWSFGPQIRVV